MTPDPAEMRDFARRYTEAWCSQDPASVAEHYAPEGSLTINGGTPSVGRAAITEAARSFMIAFPDMWVLIDDLLVQDGGISITGPSAAPTPGRAGPETACGSAGSRNGRSVTTGSSPSRKATTTRRSTTASSSTVSKSLHRSGPRMCRASRSSPTRRRGTASPRLRLPSGLNRSTPASARQSRSSVYRSGGAASAPAWRSNW
jgi:hypothetical protein